MPRQGPPLALRRPPLDWIPRFVQQVAPAEWPARFQSSTARRVLRQRFDDQPAPPSRVRLETRRLTGRNSMPSVAVMRLNRATWEESVARCRVLVVEDEAVIAILVEDMVLDFGSEVVGPAAKMDEALRLASHAPLDAAILDVNVGGAVVFPVADVLEDRGIDPPPSKWSALRYGFRAKEDHDAEEETQARGDRCEAAPGGRAGVARAERCRRGTLDWRDRGHVLPVAPGVWRAEERSGQATEGSRD